MRSLSFIILFFILLSVSGCKTKDTPAPNPIIGTTITLKSSLFLLASSQAMTVSPTALEIGTTGIDIDDLTSCTGCHFEQNLLKKVLVRGEKIKITGFFINSPPFYAVDSSPMEYVIAETDDGGAAMRFTIPMYLEKNVESRDGFGNRGEVETYERLLESFRTADEKKEFYVSISPSYQKVKFSNRNPPFSQEEFDSIFRTTLEGLRHYSPSGIAQFGGHLAFPVTTNQLGLAYLIMASHEQFFDVSPLNWTPKQTP